MVERSALPLACIAFLEAAYDWELEDAPWLRALADRIVGVWGRPRWTVAFLYDASNPDEVRFGEPVLSGASSAITDLLVGGLPRHSGRPQTVQMYRTITTGFGSPMEGVDEEAQEILRKAGTADFFGLNGLDPTGQGCFVGLGAERTALTPDELLIFPRLAAHLSAAYRARRNLRAGAAGADPLHSSEAILDGDGRVLDATGPAAAEPARLALTDATRAVQSIRRREHEPDPTSRWRPRVRGRWTLVDASDGTGRRLVAARENQTHAAGLDVLTEREQQVVASAIAGRSAKEIAYELGISHATARVLLARAYGRLGVRTRKQLFALPNIRVLRGESLIG
jgi:DNA-binding CsgD family transcriptional regulator